MSGTIAEQLINKTTFLVGNKKNAGKTTFLNYALKQVREVVSPTFFTIGIDGETSDLIFDTPKPKVYTEIGDLVVTSDSMVNKSDALFEILHVFPYKTVLGRLVLVKTLRRGTVELVGAEDNKQITEIVDFLRSLKAENTILIDGAASRATQVASVRKSNFYYIIKIDHKSVNADINKLKTIALISKFKSISEVNDVENKEVFEIEGALTVSKLLTIPENCKLLLINDFTKIFLDYSGVTELTRKLEIAYKIPYQLNSFVVILKDIVKRDFEKILEQHNIKETILYNPYEH